MRRRMRWAGTRLAELKQDPPGGSGATDKGTPMSTIITTGTIGTHDWSDKVDVLFLAVVETAEIVG